jgi:hypothetical protein
MKVKSIPSSWISRDGVRLDCNPYMSGALEARIRLEELACMKQKLSDLTKGHDGGIYNGPHFSRNYVEDAEHGVPFLGSSSMLQADLGNLPSLLKKDAESPKLSYLKVQPGMTLISCTGTIGRMVYVRPDMNDMWSSQHIMKVLPDETKVPPGYIYAFLSSKFGIPLVTSGTYGSIIQSIEPEHIAGLPVPRLGESTELEVDGLIEAAAQLRVTSQTLLERATSLFILNARLEEQASWVWHRDGPEIGFTSRIGISHSLRAFNYLPRVSRLISKLRNVEHRTLGEICSSGYLGTGARFKRIDCEPEFGVCLIGQKQGFWMRPEGRWISTAHAPSGVFAENETVMIASSGTLGEHEMYCRPIFVTGRWLKHAYTQHFLRVVSGDTEISGAYLFAFLRSELAFRCLRSMSTGSKQQEIHKALISELPIPVLDKGLRTKIETLVRDAFSQRDQADVSEDKAICLVEKAIEKAA